MRKILLTIFSILMLMLTVSELYAQPANNDCANAEVITFVTDYAFTTVDATTDGPAHPNDCVSSGDAPDTTFNDVWYSYTAAFTGMVEWTMCGTADFDTKIFVYNAGATCPLTDGDILTCSEDAGSCAGATSAVTFAVEDGMTYFFRLGGFGDGVADPEEGTGTFTLMEAVAPPMGPPNDDCANAQEIMLGNGQDFTTVDAVTDGPEHPTASCFAFGNDFVNQDVWYYYVATADGTIEWSTCSLVMLDTRMAVYEAVPGDCPMSDGDLLACNDDGAGCDNFTSLLSFEVTAGQTYLLRLGGYLDIDDFGIGTFNLNEIVPPTPPENDDCETGEIPLTRVTQTEIDLGAAFTLGTTINGTQDGVVPSCVNNGEIFDIWYTFNIGQDTTLEIQLGILTTDAAFTIEIYDDCTTPTLDVDNGGTLPETCITFGTDIGIGTYTDTLTGFTGGNQDYYLRVSTVITFNPPGDFTLFLVKPEGPNSINDDYLLENIHFFPNPVSGMAQVDLSLEEAANTNLEVLNALGQVVSIQEEGILSTGEHKLDLNTANLSSGVYFLRISADEKQGMLKFVKQ